MRQSKSHEIRVLLTFGEVVHFTTHEMRDFLYGRYVCALLITFLAGVSVSDASPYPSMATVESRLVFWSVAIAVYLLVIPYWGEAVSRLYDHAFRRAIPLLLATGPLIISITIFALWTQEMLGYRSQLWERGALALTVGKNVVMAHLVEMIALAWLLPLYRQDVRRSQQKEAQKDAPNNRQFIVLNGRSVPLAELRHVQSAEHYLMVVGNSGTRDIRARMKDFLEQVSEDNGIQTHRSFWVAADEATELDGSVVRTRSGVEIPVSRGRMPAVREWFAHHGKAH